MKNLLVTWDQSPANFIEWLKMFTSASQKTIAYLKANVKTQIDLDAWIDSFDGDLDGIERATNEFATFFH